MRNRPVKTVTLPPAVLYRARRWVAAAPIDARTGRPLERRTFSAFIARCCEVAEENDRALRHAMRGELNSIALQAELLRQDAAGASATECISAILRAVWSARAKLAHPMDRTSIVRESDGAIDGESLGADARAAKKRKGM